MLFYEIRSPWLVSYPSWPLRGRSTSRVLAHYLPCNYSIALPLSVYVCSPTWYLTWIVNFCLVFLNTCCSSTRANLCVFFCFPDDLCVTQCRVHLGRDLLFLNNQSSTSRLLELSAFRIYKKTFKTHRLVRKESSGDILLFTYGLIRTRLIY